MEILVKCFILSLIMAISTLAFLDTLLPRRQFDHSWMSHTCLPAFLAGYLVIAFTPIPAWLLQPVRLTAMISLVALLYYRAGILKNLTASILFCGIYWIVTCLTISLIQSFPFSWSGFLMEKGEEIIAGVHMGLMMLFHFRYKKRFLPVAAGRRIRFGLFSLAGLILIVSFSTIAWDGSTADGRARLAVTVSFIIVSVCLFSFLEDLIKKEEEMQTLRLLHERTLSQMNQYRFARKEDTRLRRHLHDYKNQLGCIQEMLLCGKSTQALTYISHLTGSLRKSTEYINTGHTVVNAVLNQKYQTASELGIILSMTVNDLSGLSMSEEDIVSLLGNLLDNALEACERLNQDLAKIIQFKMVLEEEELILSTRNPLPEPLQIKNNRILTRKAEKHQHGIGLLNIDSIIRSHKGVSVLKCEDGWFCFSAVIPRT